MEHKSITEFAKLKGISRQSVHNLLKNGQLDSKEIVGKRCVVYNKKARDYKPNPGRRNDLKGGKK